MRVDVLDPPAETETLEGAGAVGPVVETENVTVPAKLFLLLAVIVDVVEDPTVIVTVAEKAYWVKSELTVLTVSCPDLNTGL